MREFDLIARIAERSGHGGSSASSAGGGWSPSPAGGGGPGWGPLPRRDDIVLGLGDDAALLAPTPGMQLVAATDTLVHGVHYPPGTRPADIGWKALAVNLSDLAAMGAVPRWTLLQLTLPELQEAWLEQFLDGWCALAGSSGIALVGGDTTRGPEAIGVTVLGEVPSGAALLRSGAVAGDRVWVSGTLGDAAAALQLWREATGASKTHPMEPADEHRVRLGRTLSTPGATAPLQARLDRPVPRLALGRALRGIATACIDLSDGLLADLGHVCRASGVAAELQLAALPASAALQSLVAEPERWPLQLAGGDDYELCFTAPETRDATLQALAAASGIALTAVGRIQVGSGLRVLHPDGREYHAPRPGYEHFA